MPYGYEIVDVNGRRFIQHDPDVSLEALNKAVKSGDEAAIKFANDLRSVYLSNVAEQRKYIKNALRSAKIDPLTKQFIRAERRQLSADVKGLKENPAKQIARIFNRETMLHSSKGEFLQAVSNKRDVYEQNVVVAYSQGVNTTIREGKTEFSLVLDKNDAADLRFIYEQLTGKNFDDLLNEAVLKQNYVKGKHQLYLAIENSYSLAAETVKEIARNRRLSVEDRELLRNSATYQALQQYIGRLV